MNEPWREVADRIWNTDRKRFAHLYSWIISHEHKYRPWQIRDALLDYETLQKRGSVRNWYPYLTKVLKQQVKRSTSQAFVAKHEQIKKEEQEWGKKLRKTKNLSNSDKSRR